MPRTGTNMSCLQRSLQLIADANGGPACNKNGATVASKIGSLTLTWPVTGFPLYASPYGECDLFEFQNLGMFYVDSLLPASHPKRSELNIKASDLNALMSFLGVFVSEDDLLQESSDITGLTQYPEPSALNRLVWFGASNNGPYPSMPDTDTANTGTQTDNFISGSINPISAAWCPPDASSSMVPTCTDQHGHAADARPELHLPLGALRLHQLPRAGDPRARRRRHHGRLQRRRDDVQPHRLLR